jgi:nitroimidazol reductase NimA-like FMN-containing flavoprotein (pyridoxamine 5'-phosphate oxidase superfamily)
MSRDSLSEDKRDDDSFNKIARKIIDHNRYMILATSDVEGEPWASPVFYATDRYDDLFWISSPDATHSRNLMTRPSVAITILDTTVPVGEGQAVYIRAHAEKLNPPRDAEALEFYPGAPSRGGRPLRAQQVRDASPFRIYRARAIEHSILCPRGFGPCRKHGQAVDHRIVVQP